MTDTIVETSQLWKSFTGKPALCGLDLRVPAGSIFGFFAAVYHWFPKLTGALLREGLGKLQLLLMVFGK